MEIEVRHARVVEMINATGSLSKAAMKIGIPQPSLSAQLRRIEKAVGGSLFVRSRSGVTPTPLGERVIPMLAALAEQADAVIAEAAVDTSGVLRFGTAEWTPPTLRGALRSLLPKVDVQTETILSADAVDTLRRGALGAAMVSSMGSIVPIELSDSDLAKATIVRDPVWLALPVRHPLADHGVLGAAQLEDLCWIGYARQHWFSPVERHLLDGLGRRDRSVSHHAGGFHEAMSWVRHVGAAALTPLTGATSDVRIVPLADTQYTELTLVWHKDAMSCGTARRLVEIIRRYYYQYARSFPSYRSWLGDPTDGQSEVPDPSRMVTAESSYGF
ncbi:LysR family transcriptional regulator [Streptomyces sp. MZ04]|uniref:LysR family transcriptional regulator n=1 Tax=Streptomyces sp. MZ04 TaxID=2559236 RepID=UPI00107E91CC|nr:LysR family transcriptional regulator [Streptomyces sp. MZ04]TGB13257.1 LysR family transcriptional regulator [Streptomyces sp. MZ04]